MDNIKEFLLNFIKKEYQFTKCRYDINVTDQDCENIANKLNKSFIEENSSNYRRIGREFKNESKKQFSIENLERAIPRTLFQIKHYKDFTLGDSLKRIVTSKDLFACYVSYEQKTGYPIGYSTIFYVSETDEGLKIIYAKNYNTSVKHGWSHSHDLKVLQVLKDGTLLAVEKYEAPEEATSLADYNAN